MEGFFRLRSQVPNVCQAPPTEHLGFCLGILTHSAMDQIQPWLEIIAQALAVIATVLSIIKTQRGLERGDE